MFNHHSAGFQRPKFLRTAVVVGVSAVAVVGGGMAFAADRVAAPQALLATTTAPSDFVGITPVRVLDTRPPGRGGPIGVPAAGSMSR